MNYKPLGCFVSLSQGLVVNKSTEALFSDSRDNDHPYPLLRIVDFESGNHATYSKYVSKNVPQKVVIDEKAILFTRVTCQCFRGFSGVFHNNLFRVNLISPEIDYDYLYVVLQSDYVKKQALKYASSSVVPDLSHDKFKSILIPVPDMKEQKKIAAAYLVLQRAIEINDSIISELESVAKDIYDYWFVQFDFPDASGRPYRSSGGKMVWNKELKKEIPEGWESHSLCEYIRESKNGDWGNASPKSNSDLAVRCFRGADFSSITSNYNMTAPLRYISAKNHNRLLSEGDLIVEISGGSPTQSTGRIGYVNAELLSRSEYPMDCSNFCKAFSPASVNYTYWMYNTWSRLYEASVLFNYESKTTGIKNLMFDDFTRSMKVAGPPEKLLVRFHKLVGVLYSKIQASMKESSELAALRDWLLPMLMNGQVKGGGVA